jgi:hypothetical protein
MRPKRQKTLSFKITEEIEMVLLKVRLRLSERLDKDLSKTDVIEEAIRVLAKKEKVPFK